MTIPTTPSTAPTATTTTTTTTSRRVPLDKRKRTETSCDKCKSRKQKCRKEPGQASCRYCSLHHIECQTTQPRKTRLYGSVEGLGNRLALLESLVKRLLPEADVSNLDEMRQLASSLGIALPDAVDGDISGEHTSGSGTEGEDSLSLLPDQQGQVQYIGPSSSFSFHLKLRSLCSWGTFREFVLFGRNAADQEAVDGDSDPHALSMPGAASSIEHNPPAGRRAPVLSETSALESIVAAYFEHINLDFPILHEGSFREAYEAWRIEPAKADPAWLCSFLCVLLLGRRVARMTFPEGQERVWWRRIQTLLPVVIFTSNLVAVQALMLAAVHLHNTNHRDACWNLTGTAIRIAFAIGLHQDKVNAMQTPLLRELRKRLWWTLYTFEQMQVSSYDRPSAIESSSYRVGCPNDRTIGMGAHFPPDYNKWFNRMVVHLGSACRAPKSTKSSSSEESYVGALSPAAGVLRDLERWTGDLPRHLRMEALETSPLGFHRPLLLLHAFHHYTIIVLCRAALLARAMALSKEGIDSTNAALISMSDSCAKSGKALSRILLKLESLGKFDAITWWDTFYALASGSVLVLDLVCTTMSAGSNETSESRILLSELADLAQRHLRNPHMPGTLAKFASIVPELRAMAGSTVSSHASSVVTRSEQTHPRQIPSPPQQSTPFGFPQSSMNSGAYMFANDMPGRYFPENNFASGITYSNTRLDRSTQMSFMDFTVSNIQDWNWGDLGSLLGGDGTPSGPLGPLGPPHGPGLDPT